MPKEIPPKITRDEEKHYTNEMHICLRDFSSELQSLLYLNKKGVENVFNSIKEMKFKTFKEYLDEKRGGDLYGTITEEEERNPIMKSKTQELDSLINKINHNIDIINEEEANPDSVGKEKKMTQEELDHLIHRTFEIVNSPIL